MSNDEVPPRFRIRHRRDQRIRFLTEIGYWPLPIRLLFGLISLVIAVPVTVRTGIATFIWFLISDGIPAAVQWSMVTGRNSARALSRVGLSALEAVEQRRMTLLDLNASRIYRWLDMLAFFVPREIREPFWNHVLD